MLFEKFGVSGPGDGYFYCPGGEGGYFIRVEIDLYSLGAGEPAELVAFAFNDGGKKAVRGKQGLCLFGVLLLGYAEDFGHEGRKVGAKLGELYRGAVLHMEYLALVGVIGMGSARGNIMKGAEGEIGVIGKGNIRLRRDAVAFTAAAAGTDGRFVVKTYGF